MNVESHVESGPLAKSVNDTGAQSRNSTDHKGKHAASDECVNAVLSTWELIAVAVYNSNYQENIGNFSDCEKLCYKAMGRRVVVLVEVSNARSKNA